MSHCKHFSLLQNRVKELTEKFIFKELANEQESPLTFVPDLDLLAAYRLLVHGELEDFLEQKAKEGISKVETEIKSGVSFTEAFPALVILAGKLKKEIPADIITNKEKRDNFIQSTIHSAKEEIKDNNGIKENSFLFLSICAGKNLEELDEALAAILNSYGKNRGDVAHTSVTKCRTLQAPSAEYNAVFDIISGLSKYFYKT
ncbi:hypothetical protein [Pseudoroseomonas cervicalis]|uniref:hypothetical protein n=1 Tax=Teichococcus cervicalis TaxID=204525 RepID=UPI0022F1CAF9|nr:hypothetical protein [Pseudoroseomonas cervicalis]WBV41878.1 hypothetical protein PFY06_11585 [Pseudoroseomonas cervicalis]